MSYFQDITLPDPLRAQEPGTFTHYSVTQRLLDIGRQMLADNNFDQEVKAGIEQLLDEIPASKIRLLADNHAPDAQKWAAFIQPYIGQNWLQVPWFFAETYFYRRILEATAYFGPGSGKGVDPFSYQKKQGLSVSREAIRLLAGQVKLMHEGQVSNEEILARLLLFDLWGNQVDLSLWPVGVEEKPDHNDSDEQEAHTLVNDSARVAQTVFSGREPARRVDFILDNAGFELVADLFLAATMLDRNMTGQIVMHAKPHPTFVSDAMIVDVRQSITWLAEDDDPQVIAIARSLASFQEEGRLRISEDWFWTSPLEMWLMPKKVRAELAKADLIISKGDANYRRLLGDRHWPKTTRFAEVVAYMPAPLLALRTLKSEIAVGLRLEQIEELDQKDPDWIFDGRWGVIQYWDGIAGG